MVEKTLFFNFLTLAAKIITHQNSTLFKWVILRQNLMMDVEKGEKD